ncbi:hypothetical protein [Paraburkholderia youngii]|uniref:hypothetical protein n=1 Tax=Paraburkholderia youngii TaxID=2782701 RepID=UPI003D24EE28
MSKLKGFVAITRSSKIRRRQRWRRLDCSRTILFSRDVSNPLHLRRLIVASSLTRHNLPMPAGSVLHGVFVFVIMLVMRCRRRILLDRVIATKPYCDKTNASGDTSSMILSVMRLDFNILLPDQ